MSDTQDLHAKEAPESGEPLPENEPELAEEDLPDECDVVEVEMMEATATAIGSVSTIELDARQSAICQAAVEGDAEISTSLVGMVKAGGAGLYRSAAGAVVSADEATIDQGFAELVVADSVDIDRSGACMVVAGDASVARSWVGMMAARNATLSDDSRVIIDAKAALIIGLLMFGGLGLVAGACYLGARRIASRIPRLPWMAHHRGRHHRGMPHLAMHRPEMPHVELPHVQMPGISKLTGLAKSVDVLQVAPMIARLRRGA